MTNVQSTVTGFTACAAGAALIVAIGTHSLLPVLVVAGGLTCFYVWLGGGTESLYGKGGGQPVHRRQRRDR